MAKTDDNIIRLENVRKSFGRQVVLDGVNLSLQKGQTTVIIGPSGCGKSVLLKHIIGLIRPDQGKVFFHDSEVSALGEKDLVAIRRKIGFLFQGAALFDSMTVAENICFPLQEHDIGDEAQRAKRVREVLSVVGLEEAAGKMPEELSGGQKKRIALARAIVLQPEVILYDEPTTGLDPIRADMINELIIRLKHALGVTSLVVTHDMASARKVGDRVVMLYGGHFIADAPPAELADMDNEVVMRFVEGRASQEELGQLEAAHLGQGPKE